MGLSANSLQNVSFGAVNLTMIPNNGTPIELGLTQGGAVIGIEPQGVAMKFDQTGTSTARLYYSGMELTLKVNLAETQLDRLAVMLPGTSLATDAESGKKVLTFGDPQEFAKEFGLKGTPVSEGQKGFDFPKVSIQPGTVEYAFSNEKESIFSVTFVVLPDIQADGTVKRGNITEKPKTVTE